MVTEPMPGGVVISARGRVGVATAGAFADALAAGSTGALPVVIDLEGVDYISGPGVAALRAAAARGEGRAILCGLQESVRITLELAGVLGTAPVEPDRATALARLTRQP